MIDPFDAALSEFIDTLPEGAIAAQELLEASAPFTGQGDLPALAELATTLRSVPAHQPRPEWVAASKARLIAAPVLPVEKRGFTSHLTVARFDPPAPVADAVQELMVPRPPFEVDRLVLYRSFLQRPAPRYEPLREFPLGGR